MFILFLFASGHSGEVIPVPIPNTEVKLPCADDTALLGGKVGSRWLFYFKLIPCFFGRDFFYVFLLTWKIVARKVEISNFVNAD